MRTPQRPLALGALLVLACLSARGVEPTPGRLKAASSLQAMRDELARSMDKLHMEGMERPYFMAYQVADVEESTAVAHLRRPLIADPRGMREKRRERTLTVEVRVGDRDLDNTNFMPTRPSGRRLRLPLDDNYRELRRRIWLATDAAYKNALERLAKKRAALQSRTREEALDFGAASPAEVFRRCPAQPGRRRGILPGPRPVARLQGRARRRRLPGRSIFHFPSGCTTSTAKAAPSRGTSRRSTLGVEAKTQAVDGMVLQDFEAFHGYQWDDLPNREAMIRRVRALGETLAARRRGRVRGSLQRPPFSSRARPRRSCSPRRWRRVCWPPGCRFPNDRTWTAPSPGSEIHFWTRSAPGYCHGSSMSGDDPTLAEYRGRPLFGGYSVDDDGVPAAPTVLV